MSVTVVHLVGRFPVLYEGAILQEIAALERGGSRCFIAALQAGYGAVPEAFAGVESRVRYLDAAQRCGRVASTAASLAAGFAGLLASPLSLGAALAQAPGFDPTATAWRRVRLEDFLKRARANILHVQFGHLGFLAAPVARRLNTPMVLSFRGQDVLLVSRASEKQRLRLFEASACVLARSEAMCEELAGLGCPKRKTFAHPSGINPGSIPFTARMPPGRGEPVYILSVGRLVPKKGTEDAIRALAQARPGDRGPRLWILGDGPERGPLRRLADRLGIGARVEFVGEVPNEQVTRDFMPRAHLFLLPSRTAHDGEKEGLPNAIKEAQASGLPVISTRHAGIPECVLDGVSGLLAPEGDVDAIARNLDLLLKEPERWCEMGRHGRKIIEERYDAAKLAQTLALHYDMVLQEAGDRST